MSKIIQIIPAGDRWFFAHDDAQNKGKKIIHRVAVWALLEDGTVKGMVDVVNAQGGLVFAPPVPGKYYHIDDKDMPD